MRKNKLLLLLALLMTAATGAWAQDAFGVKELVAPADWETDEAFATKGDFPGFDGITIDQAKTWTGAPSSGVAVLFYNIDGETISYAVFFNGEFNSNLSESIQRVSIYNAIATGTPHYYTAAPEPAEPKHLITATHDEQTRSLEQPLPYATTIGELYEAVTGESFSSLISTMSLLDMPLSGISSNKTDVVSIGELNGASTPVTVNADGKATIGLRFGNFVKGIFVNVVSPLYAYMKDGVKDADKWTVKVGEGQAQALPIGGLKGDGSETVTLQYNGRLKVKGVKAVKKAKPAAVTYIGTKSPTEAKAVGDIVFSDGSATAYTSGLTLTDEQKAAAVAVIFYAGSASDILGAKTLGVGLKNTNDETTKYLAFARNASGTAEGYNTNITAIQCTPSESGDGKAATATFTGDLDGSDNWTALCAAVNDEGTSGNYPAWEWVNAYATTANLTGEYASGWYLPTVAELCMLYRAKDTVNAALEKADGTIIVDNYYWSSSQSSSTNNKAWMVKFDIGKLIDTYKGNKWYVCGVRAFN